MKVKLYGTYTEERIKEEIRLSTAAGKLSRFDGDVFEILELCDDSKKNLEYNYRTMDNGHETTIEHRYYVFAVKDVSFLIEQIAIRYRLASFTIKSRRAVDFRKAGYFVPEFRDLNGNLHSKNNLLKDLYKENVNHTFDEYSYFVDNNIPPEDARFLYQYSLHSNFFIGMNGRELSKFIIASQYGKLSKIKEFKEFGANILKEAEKAIPEIPYLMELAKTSNYEERNFFEEEDKIRSLIPPAKILNEPIMLSYTENCDDEILTSYLMGKYQCTKDDAKRILNELSSEDPDFKNKLMKHIITANENRELEQINFKFQNSISLSILPHWTRHRMHSLIVPDFTPIWNLDDYAIPPTIQAFDEERYREAFRKNKELYEYFRNEGVMEEDLIYFYQGGQMCNFITNINGRSLLLMSRLRHCKKAQWQIRDDFIEIKEQVKSVAPIYGSFLGPSCEILGKCPEKHDNCKKKKKKKP